MEGRSAERVIFGGLTERVHLVGVSISFEKNFYRLPFTPPLSGRLIGHSHFYRARRGRAGDGGEQWPSMPWRPAASRHSRGEGFD
jgi:hypothetical protein